MKTMRQGDRGGLVKKLQEALVKLGYKPGTPDGVYGQNTEDAVEAFQDGAKLYTDGKAGRDTCMAINAALTNAGGYYEQLPEFEAFHIPMEVDTSEPMGEPEDKLPWKKCPADKFEGRGGYERTTLRGDTAVVYTAMYHVCHSLGGIITSAGGKRPLASSAGKNRSKKSLHYVGRAFDMALPTAMRDPDKDPYIIVRDGDSRYWNVWCVSALSEESLSAKCQALGIEGGLVTLTGTYLSGKKIKTKTVEVVAFNFTQLAKLNGFDRIPARSSFFSKGTYGAAEWWHFSWRDELIKGQTTFGEELLKVYSLTQCKKFVYWDDVKNAVYGEDFFG